MSEEPAQVQRVSTGIPGFDPILEGGFLSGGLYLIEGPPGRGEAGVYFGFSEPPDAIRKKAARVHIELTDPARGSAVELAWERPIETIIDMLADHLIATVKRTKARRLCLDGLQGFQLSISTSERTREVMSALGDELEWLGVTTVFTTEMTNLYGHSAVLDDIGTGVSAITHNLILLRHPELDGRLRRLLTIVKVRDSDFDSAVHEYSITDRGLVVRPLAARNPPPEDPSQGADWRA